MTHSSQASQIPTYLSPKGPTCSRIVWGAWRLMNQPAEERLRALPRFLEQAFEWGISSFDHADIYGGYTAEAAFGKAFKDTQIPRAQIQLISKCGIKLVHPARPNHRVKSYDCSGAHIVSSVEQSLKNLQTEYLDLLLIHRPDPLMNPHELAGTFGLLKLQGKVRSFGVSNFSPSQFEALAAVLKEPLVTNQFEWSLMHLNPMKEGCLDQALKYQFRPMIWSPLGGGRLGESRDQSPTPLMQCLSTLAKKYQCRAEQIALAWLLKHPSGPCLVLGTQNIDRLKAGKAAMDIDLEREDWYELWAAARGHEID